MGLPRPLFCLFSFFSLTILQKNCRPQRDLNWDRRIRRRACWPLDHHHGPPSILLCTQNNCSYNSTLGGRNLISACGVQFCLVNFCFLQSNQSINQLWFERFTVLLSIIIIQTSINWLIVLNLVSWWLDKLLVAIFYSNSIDAWRYWNALGDESVRMVFISSYVGRRQPLETETEIWKQELWWSSSALLKLLQSKFESRWSVFSLNMFEKSENKLMGVSIISG